MISPAVLEGPGLWRTVGVGTLACVAAAPALALLAEVVGASSLDRSLGAGFGSSVARNVAAAAASGVCALALGLPSGVVAALYRFPGRTWLLGALALPLILPPFLWAIGLSMLRIELGLPRDGLLSGAPAVVWSFAALGTPLVLFAVLVTARLLPRNAIDAARLAGGEPTVLRHTLFAVLPAGLAAALVAALVSLADPGPGQILGFSGVASQILISFSALYDFELAARQSLAAALVVLAAAAPIVAFTAGRLTLTLLPSDTALVQPRSAPAARWAGPLLLGGVLLVTLLAPVTGLLLPLGGALWLESVLATVARTAANTLYYGVAAGGVATACALPLAACASRSARLRGVLLGALLLVVVLPPAAGALGVLLLAADAPAWLDPLLRSRFTVAAVLGLRLTVVAAVVLLRAFGSASPSWSFAAAVHGVPLATYLGRVLAPFLAGPIAVSVALVALVAIADVTTVLLLAPPGSESLPVALFTVMANAPESLVASLCLAYLLLGAAVLAAIALLARLRVARTHRG